jgi:hypothetical protein
MSDPQVRPLCRHSAGGSSAAMNSIRTYQRPRNETASGAVPKTAPPVGGLSPPPIRTAVALFHPFRKDLILGRRPMVKGVTCPENGFALVR